MKELLSKIGLEEKEIEVYLSCLNNELSTPTDIAKQTGIKRTTIYFYLSKLVARGLITYKVRKTKKYIQALPPRKALLNYVEKNRAELNEQEKAIEKFPIDQIVKLKNNKTEVYYYEGKEGVNLIIDKILTGKKDIYWLGSIETILSVINEEKFYKLFTVKRMTHKTTAYALTDRKILQYSKFSEMLGNFRSLKLLDQKFEIPGLLVLFEGTICLISKGYEIKTVIIEDDLMYNMVYFLFQSYWNILPTPKT